MAADVKGIIYGINGPVIYIKGKTAFRMVNGFDVWTAETGRRGHSS